MRVLILCLMAFPVSVLALPGDAIPAGQSEAHQRLEDSPRRNQLVSFKSKLGDTIQAHLAYPEGSGPAPVVVAIHGRGGWTDWVRAVADQLAAEGYIAIAPDMISGKGPGGGGTDSVDRDGAAQVVYSLTWEEIVDRVNAAADYALALPTAHGQFAVVGFCWGGTTTFAYAAERTDLSAGLVYYGSSPPAEVLARIQTPILGLYGGNDNRVNVTIEPAAKEMNRLGKVYEYEVFEGAGHGFLSGQERLDGANLAASQKGWLRTVEFLRKHLKP